MGWLDTFLKRVLIGGSVLVVVVLSAVAILSAVNAANEDSEVAESDVGAEDVAPRSGRVVPGLRVQVQDSLSPLSIGCLPSADDDGTYVIVIQNQGRTETPYTVAATLVDDSGASAEVTVEIPALLPGQVVESPINSARLLDDELDSCRVTAVQTDRRVVLFD